MPYYIRLMRKEDIAQVTEIDQEAFPTMWPPANYERELQTRLAHYIVAHEESKKVERTRVTIAPEQGSISLLSRVQHLFSYNHSLSLESPPPTEEQYIAGFAGFWMMTDEAHITSVAVQKNHRRQGIGEFLLISVIDLALELKARILTLEVRASNLTAQDLYYKYGFRQVGIRQGYYTDDKENALVMAAEDIISTTFQKRLNRLKKAHSRRWGIAFYHIAR